MSIDVEPSDPPALNTGVDAAEYDDAEVAGGDDYRREELAAFLREGAWDDAWERWASETDLTHSEYAIVRELGVLAGFDFFWDVN